VGAKIHPRAVRAVTWHVEAAVDGVLAAVKHHGGGQTHLGPVPFTIVSRSGSRWPPMSP
jgi:hypothetical protein